MKRCGTSGCPQWAYDPQRKCYFHTKDAQGLFDADYTHPYLTPDQIVTDERFDLLQVLALTGFWDRAR